MRNIKRKYIFKKYHFNASNLFGIGEVNLELFFDSIILYVMPDSDLWDTLPGEDYIVLVLPLLVLSLASSF